MGAGWSVDGMLDSGPLLGALDVCGKGIHTETLFAGGKVPDFLLVFVVFDIFLWASNWFRAPLVLFCSLCFCGGLSRKTSL